MGESRPQSVLKASIEILPYRHPAGLIGAGYDARNILLWYVEDMQLIQTQPSVQIYQYKKVWWNWVKIVKLYSDR